MKYLASLAVLGAAFVAAAPSASATTILYGKINTVGNANFVYPPQTFFVSPTGAATLQLTDPSGSGSPAASVTGPGPTGNFGTLGFGSATVTDFSFSTSTFSSAPTKILSFGLAGDTVSFFATGTGAFTATNLPTTEGTLVLYGYLSDTSGLYSNNSVELDISANGIGNNFTEDLSAATPEPNSLMLLGTGLLGAGGMLIRRRKCTA